MPRNDFEGLEREAEDDAISDRRDRAKPLLAPFKVPKNRSFTPHPPTRSR